MSFAIAMGLVTLLGAGEADADATTLLVLSCEEKAADEAGSLNATVEGIRALGWYRILDRGDLQTVASFGEMERLAPDLCCQAESSACEGLQEEVGSDHLLLLTAKGEQVEAKWIPRQGTGSQTVAAPGDVVSWLEGELSPSATPIAGVQQPLAEVALDWTWLAAGATLLTATGALLISLNAQSLEQTFQHKIALSRTEPQSATDMADLRDHAQSQATMANVMWGVTAACGVATVVIFILELAGRQLAPGGEGNLVLAPTVGPGFAGLTARGELW